MKNLIITFPSPFEVSYYIENDVAYVRDLITDYLFEDIKEEVKDTIRNEDGVFSIVFL